MPGRLPCLITADEYAFPFTPGLVRSILPRFGFNVLSVKTYQPWHKFKPFAQSIRDDDGQLPKRIIKATTYQLARLLADKIPSRGDHKITHQPCNQPDLIGPRTNVRSLGLPRRGMPFLAILSAPALAALASCPTT